MSVKDSEYLPYLYTEHITEDMACYGSYYKNFYVEKNFSTTNVKIIFKPKIINQEFLRENAEYQDNNYSQEDNNEMNRLEMQISDKFNKGGNILSQAKFSVLITVQGKPGGMIYECHSETGFIKIENVINLKNDQETMKFIYLNLEDKERLQMTGSNFDMVDFLSQESLIDYLFVHGITNNIARMIEMYSSELFRLASVEFYDNLQDFFKVETK